MSKLYPPLIENTIPAFFGDTLTIPFEFNRAVSKEQIDGLCLILKTVQNNVVKENELFTNGKVKFMPSDNNKYLAVFQLSTPLNIGQYYKVQIAFREKTTKEIGYYSTASITKYTAMPKVIIDGLKPQGLNTSKYIYTGVYESKNDPNEKVYSYCFDIIDIETKELFDTSGEKIHNSSTDTSIYSSNDTWATSKALVEGKTYEMTYSVKTLNGLEISSNKYSITSSTNSDLPLNINANLIATLHEEDAYVDIHMKQNAKYSSTLEGNFILIRASSEDNFENWYEIYRFSLKNEKPNFHLWDDFTVNQGYEYKYALQSYNANGVYSARLLAINYLCEADELINQKANHLIVEFEDSFLFDGERQLKIRYNPKVSSFKSTILETKVNTLGGKYPFVFRNGNVEYKEFPISGLISILSDVNGKFLKQNEQEENRIKTFSDSSSIVSDTETSLSRENFCRERNFKMKALEWLSNGEPKLFRSPGEGSYIVRLTNISLTPLDALSRMLHSFNCTASEIAEYNFFNLEKYKLAVARKEPLKMSSYTTEDRPVARTFALQKAKQQEYRKLKIGMKPLPEILKENTFSFSEWNGARYLSFDNQQNELILKVVFSDGSISSITFNISNASDKYTIPAEVLADNPILSITLLDGTPSPGATMTFGYYDIIVEEAPYTRVNKVDLQEKVRQFSGYQDSEKENIIDALTDIRQKPSRFNLIKIMPKKTYKIYTKNNKYYFNSDFTKEVIEWQDIGIYYIVNQNKYYCGNPNQGKVLKGTPNYLFRLNSDLYSNLMPEGMTTQGRFESIQNIDQVNMLSIGSGLICEVIYILKVYTYSVETENFREFYPELFNAKEKWMIAYNKYLEGMKGESSESEIIKLKEIADTAYNIYISYLTAAIENEDQKGEAVYAL